ncbi:MAG: hypothetical protein R3D55_03815 [Chloroflexota bacterium]
MENSLPKICKNERRCVFIYLIGLNVVRLALQVYLFQQGFLSVAADEFARGIRAAKWAQSLNIDVLADVQGVWLPFEKYLNGLTLLIWPDTILAPRATVFLASCLLIVVLYFLVRYLFASHTAAFITTFFIAFQPWFVWLSGTPMLEMYYFVLFFAGLLLLLIWLKEQRPGYWVGAGFCLLLSSGFHVQSWTLINLVNLLTLPSFFSFVKQKKWQNVFQLIGYYFLSNGLIIAFSLIEFFYTGEVFAFLAKHTSYSKWYYGGYDVPALEKFLYYPRLVWRNTHVAIWAGLALGLAFWVQDKARRWAIFPLVLTLSGLLLNSVMNIFSGPPSAAPDRYSLFHVIVFSLYVGYGLARLLTVKPEWLPKYGRYATRFGALLLLIYGLRWSVQRIPNFPQGMSPDTVDAGQAVNTLLMANPGTFMVELHYWDFLSVELAANHFDDILYDRVRDSLNRDLPSVFAQDDVALCQVLAVLPELRYVVLMDEGLKARVEPLVYLAPVQNEGRWTIYQVIPEQSPGVVGCN